MTTVEARIAETLAQHRASDGYEECSCGYGPESFVFSERRALHFAHVAAVLANHPNIAIIERSDVEFGIATSDDPFIREGIEERAARSIVSRYPNARVVTRIRGPWVDEPRAAGSDT